MSKRSSCCNGVLTVFRVVQFLLSLTALGCGVWICYTMFSMASSAHSMENAIDTLLDPVQRQQIESELGSTFTDLDISDADVQDFAEVLDSVLVPVLHVLEGTPVRAILISVAALWSTIVILYLHFAQRSSRSTTHQRLPSEPNTPNLPGHHRPRRNRRCLRVCLSLFTILFWLVALIAACMLAAEYSITLFAGGAEMKVAFSTIKVLLEKALESAFEGDDHAILRSLDIVNDILTIGALAILAIAASVICGAVEIISLLVACCVSGKVKHKPAQMQQYPQSRQHQYQQVHGTEADEALIGNAVAYTYGNSPTQMGKRPMVVYATPYVDEMSGATTPQTQIPMTTWSHSPDQPRATYAAYSPPNMLISPTWSPGTETPPASPPQPHTANQVRRKPVA